MTTKAKPIKAKALPMCVGHKGGWCALARGANLDPNAMSDATACGHFVIMRSGSCERTPDCAECIGALGVER